MFDELRQAVNRTHGSLHHAFLAWDKGGTGELSKARLRVGLRACRGALERDVEAFMDNFAPGLDDGKITFNRLYHAFHEGEKRFPVEETSPSRKKSLPPFFATRSPSPPRSTSRNSQSQLDAEEEELSKSISSLHIPSPNGSPRSIAKQETYNSPLRSRELSYGAISPSFRTPYAGSENGVTSPPTSSVSRRLDFNVGEEPRRNSSTRATKDSISPRTVSPSSERFRREREARMSPSFFNSTFESRSPSPPLLSVPPMNSGSPLTSSLPQVLRSSAEYDMNERRQSMMGKNRMLLSSPPLPTMKVSSPAPIYRTTKTSPDLPVRNFDTIRPSSPALVSPLPRVVESARKSPKLNGISIRSSLRRSEDPGFRRGDQVLDRGMTMLDDAAMMLSLSSMIKDGESLLSAAVRADLRATLLTWASESPSSPVEATISPSDLRRSLHAVDPRLTRQDVRILTRHLMGGYSPQRVRISQVLNALDAL